MICLQCKKLDLRAYPKHAAVGIGRCAHKQLPGVFVTFTKHRDCPQFEAADPEIVKKREEWWENLCNSIKEKRNEKL